MFCGFYCRGIVGFVHNQTWCRKKKGVLAESEATFLLSRGWKMMRPICSMQGETVPCRLTDFKAVRLCYVPPSLILGAAGELFFWSTDSNSTIPSWHWVTSQGTDRPMVACVVLKIYLLWEMVIIEVHFTFSEAHYYVIYQYIVFWFHNHFLNITYIFIFNSKYCF